MGIKVALEHRTSYTFDRLVEVYPHVVRLRPAPHSRTPIEAYSLQVEPADHFINWQQDAFGNFLARLVFPTRARSLTITVGLIADMKVINPFDFFIEEYAEHYGFAYPPELAADLEPYLRQVDEGDPGSGPGPLVTGWLKDFTIVDETRIVDFLVQLSDEIRHVGGLEEFEEELLLLDGLVGFFIAGEVEERVDEMTVEVGHKLGEERVLFGDVGAICR